MQVYKYLRCRVQITNGLGDHAPVLDLPAPTFHQNMGCTELLSKRLLDMLLKFLNTRTPSLEVIPTT